LHLESFDIQAKKMTPTCLQLSLSLPTQVSAMCEKNSKFWESSEERLFAYF